MLAAYSPKKVICYRETYFKSKSLEDTLDNSALMNLLVIRREGCSFEEGYITELK